MPAPTNFSGSSLKGRLLLGLSLACLSGSVFAHGGYEPRPASLRLDKSVAAPNPFRLSIARSDYRMIGSYVPVTGKRQAAGELSPAIERHARAKGLDPDLVHAVIRAESAYRPEAVSPKGAIGLMQVMPATGLRFGVADLSQPEGNLRAGTAYLRHLLDRFHNVPLALAAYNAGEGAVIRHGKQIPPYPETQDYVRIILRDYGDVVTVSTRPRVYSEGLHLSQDYLSEYRLIRSSLK
jgi:soluble lytic murein transglycosylase-like protein